MPLVLRSIKGAPLTNDEVDGNFTYLNTTKLSVSDTATLATSAVNLSGGDAGYIPYQTAENTTEFLAPGTAGYVLVSNGAGAPSWAKATAGATGAGDDKIFWENDQIVTGDYSISVAKNAGSFGPITIAAGVEVTIPNDSTWTIV